MTSATNRWIGGAGVRAVGAHPPEAVADDGIGSPVKVAEVT